MTIALGPRPNGEGTFEGTLARTQISGGTPREIQEGIRGADCTPDERSCAFVRQVAGQFRLEFPEGNVLYRTGGYISSPRISPDGTRVAFFDHPAVADDSGTVAVADLHGHVRTLTPEWASQDGLAWSADGREIWFTAGEEGPSGSLYAVSLSGRLRVVERTAGGLTLHDIARDGRVLLSRTNRRYGILLDAPDATTREPDLGWFEASISEDISPDGKTLLFTEWGQAAGANYAACLRRLDGSGPVRLGSGAIAALSPDGKTALSVDRHPPSALLLLPTRAGEPKRIADASMTYQTSPGWLPDGHRVVFCGNEKGRGVRVYVQDLQGGPARPISPEGFDIREGAHPISPDGERIAVFDSDQKVFLLPTRGGTPTPLPELDGYEPIRWTQDGQALLAIEPGELPAKVYRLNVAARTKELARKLMPSDAAGLTDVFGVEVTPDERTYVYTYSRILSDLFIVEGLR
jgi:Tol biopolymer transport system component